MSERRESHSKQGHSVSLLHDQRGKSSIRGIIALVLIVAMVYVGMKLIPVQAAAYQFDDAVRDEVVFAGGRRSSDDTIKRNLMDRALMLGLPIGRDDIRITRPGAKYIIVEVEYNVAIEFVGGYTYERSFSPRHEGPLIF